MDDDVRNIDDGSKLLQFLFKGNDKIGICLLLREVIGSFLSAENDFGISFRYNIFLNKEDREFLPFIFDDND
jgi:hypothetical protein